MLVPADLVDELQRTAKAVEQELARRAHVAGSAGVAWTGPSRAVFDDEHRRLVARARLLSDACRRAAVPVADDRRELTRRGRCS